MRAIAALMVLVLSAPSVMAAEKAPAYPFANLPGVQAPKAEAPAPLNCTSTLEDVRDDDGAYSWRSGPVFRRVYTCEDGGVTTKSTEPPRLYDWNVYKGTDGIIRKP